METRVSAYPLCRLYLEMNSLFGTPSPFDWRGFLDFAAGFPQWPTVYNIPRFSSSGTWPGGFPDVQALSIGMYNVIAPNRCIAP